jgi:hypothetical protein
MLGDVLRERALCIREERKSLADHLAAPYEAAEKEALRPLDCGMLLSDDNIELTTDAGLFCEGDIAFCAERRRLTLWGHCSDGHKDGATTSNDKDPHAVVFRYVNLPCDIEPGNVTTRRNGRVLTINMLRPMGSHG